MSILNKYLTMLYYAIEILGSNEIGPVNTIEMIYVTSVLLLSSMLNTQIFGEIVLLVMVFSRKDVSN